MGDWYGWWCLPLIQSTWETETGDFYKVRPAWATIRPYLNSKWNYRNEIKRADRAKGLRERASEIVGCIYDPFPSLARSGPFP